MSPTTMLREAIEALYPPRPAATRRRIRRSGSSTSSHSRNGSLHESNLPQFSPVGVGVGRAATTPNYSDHPPLFISPSRNKLGGNSSRFSELLLEHGEKDLHQDWAVCASSSPLAANPFDVVGGDRGGTSDSCNMKQVEGRLRLCSHSIVFEPRQITRGIIRVPFRHMTFLGEGSHAGNGLDNIMIGGDVDAVDPTSARRINIHGNNINRLNAVATIRCERHVVMKANNVIGPYHTVQSPVEFSFRFMHSSPSPMISLANQLLDMETSSKKVPSVSFSSNVVFDTSAPPIIPLPSNNNHRGEVIEKIMGPTLTRQFDNIHFLHAQERPLTPSMRCSMKSPLLDHEGCAILTDFGLYFQPVLGTGTHNDYGNGVSSGLGNVGTRCGKAQMWSLDDMRAIARRYDGMKDTALEIYLLKQHSILLAFESTLVRERVIHMLSQKILEMKSLPLPCYTDRSFVESALELWQAGELDNFEYLLCLNAAAGRSFHDLSRYPVFPWVLSNYENDDDDDDDDLDESPPKLDLTDPAMFRDLSKPIGALNSERFQDFKKRYDGMIQQQKSQSAQQHTQDAPFMYGTHYSAPGYVLYYLLRVMPEHMLCLQNGKFDVPDRLFHSIDSSYKSVLTNPTDLKELIPEFYDPDCFDFLLNSTGLQLGNLQDGQRVNDVLLPSWAKSAKSFLQQNRAALECEYCTQHLPEWIDLIFGCLSRGSGAKDAYNLFHPLAYIGPEEVHAISGAEGRASASLQATEFGIVPDQLFARKHPGKREIGGWGDSDVLLTRDRLRDSYGEGDHITFSALAANIGRLSVGTSTNNVDARIENKSSVGGRNPFD